MRYLPALIFAALISMPCSPCLSENGVPTAYETWVREEAAVQQSIDETNDQIEENRDQYRVPPECFNQCDDDDNLICDVDDDD